MHKNMFIFILFFSFLVLVACTPNPNLNQEPTGVEPTPTLPTPTFTQPTEPIPESTPTSEPTDTPTPDLPTHTPEPTIWKPQRSDKLCEPNDSFTCTVLYVFTDQYDDEHTLRLSPYLARRGYTIVVASDTLEEIQGYHECFNFTPANPDLMLEDVDVSDYDAIIFVGSDGNTTRLHRDSEAHRVALDAMVLGKVIAGIGDGPVILAYAGLLDGVTVNVKNNVSMHGIGEQWINAVERNGAIFSEVSPVRDGLFITADFVTADFALGLIEMLEEQMQ